MLEEYKPLLPIFARVGGKTKLADKIISLFPPEKYIKTYVECFVGGGSIFFRKKPAQINVINDLDKDIYNIYNDIPKIKGNIDNFDFRGDEKLFEKLKKTNSTNPEIRLYRNLYLSKNSYMGRRNTYGTDDRYKDETKKGSRMKNYFNDYKNKLSNTIILNKDYKDVIREFDSETTLFYLDPPYSQQEKSWGYNEGGTITPEELLKTLLNIKGFFVMSYDYSPENYKLFNKHFIVKILNTKYEMTKGSPKDMKEILVLNYK